MSDVGLTLAWLAVQVTLLLVPALALHAVASRRGPVAGAWVAVLGLALVVVLDVGAVVPRGGDALGGGRTVGAAKASTVRPDAHVEGKAADGSAPMAWAPGWSVEGLARALGRLERGVSVPATRVRPWGRMFAVIAAVAVAYGLLRLAIGLWAVAACCRSGRTVDEAEMVGLLAELCAEMGCGRRVRLREVADLETPATAGWVRPVVFLPRDWRGWSGAERRAVLAHELAHVVRHDYVCGVVARAAVALNFQHPLVCWLAARLQLQQELAADALAAGHAGGRGTYLVALSSLTLRQNGRIPSWPARAFLPGRGTLIRRIAMLRKESQGGTVGGWRSWSSRAVIAGVLAVTAVGVANLRRPALAAENPGQATAESEEKGAGLAKAPAPLPTEYVDDTVSGLVAIRPAALLRHSGMGPIAALLDEGCAMWLGVLSGQSRMPGHGAAEVRLEASMIESIMSGVRFDEYQPPTGERLHRIKFEAPVVRMVAPFDWLEFFRQRSFTFAEVHLGEHVYYKITSSNRPLGRNRAVYLPDDRTVAVHTEDVIRKRLTGKRNKPPAFLRGDDWQRAARGLAAIAFDNHDDSLIKQYDLKRPDDAVVIALLQGVERLVVGVDDTAALTLRGSVKCPRAGVAGSFAAALEVLRQKGFKAIDEAPTPRDASAIASARLSRDLLKKLRIEKTDQAVEFNSEGFATLADFPSMFGTTNEVGAAPKASAGDDAKRRR